MMPCPERYLFVFAYHRVGRTDLWRATGSTLGRVGPDEPWQGPGVRLAQQSDQVVFIDVTAEWDRQHDFDALSRGCEEQAHTEFRRLLPQAQLDIRA
jgi:hypothetical protein